MVRPGDKDFTYEGNITTLHFWICMYRCTCCVHIINRYFILVHFRLATRIFTMEGNSASGFEVTWYLAYCGCVWDCTVWNNGFTRVVPFVDLSGSRKKSRFIWVGFLAESNRCKQCRAGHHRCVCVFCHTSLPSEASPVCLCSTRFNQN